MRHKEQQQTAKQQGNTKRNTKFVAFNWNITATKKNKNKIQKVVSNVLRATRK